MAAVFHLAARCGEGWAAFAGAGGRPATAGPSAASAERRPAAGPSAAEPASRARGQAPPLLSYNRY